MLETLFHYFLKLTPVQYQDGKFLLQTGSTIFFIVVVLAVLFLLFVIYRNSDRFSADRTKQVSIGLRAAALFLLCLPFLEPAMMVPDVIPNENFVVVLADNSASMGIPDGVSGGSRYDDIPTILGNPQDGLRAELAEVYKLRYYAFNRQISRLDSLGPLDPGGVKTDLSGAIDRIISDFKGLPLSGIVLFTDGADNSLVDPKIAAEKLRSQSIPLHIVGLGKETLEAERELLEVKTNKALKEGIGAEIEVKARSWSDERENVTIDIFDGEDLVHTKPVQLKGTGKVDYFSFSFEPENKGARQYSVQLSPAEGETNLENNSLNMLLDSSTDTVRVLHFQGHLNTEFKFLKRALERDPAVAFTSLSRTNADKFYRQGIRSATELSGGFPVSEKELFQYKVILFGDIEAEYFSKAQLSMIEKFVRKRGGGFLMSGGNGAFKNGAYQNTTVADVLPVLLKSSSEAVKFDFNDPRAPKSQRGFKFLPTREGLDNPVLKLSADLTQNKLLWDEMPNLFSLNSLGVVKPGAQVLAEKPEDRYGESKPLLVTQRYGSGRTAALATLSTWRWKMLRDAADTRHERFWRQMVHWLAENAYDPINIALSEERIEPESELSIQLSLFDPEYNPLPKADIAAAVIDPAGNRQPLQFLPDLTEEGEYQAPFITADAGVYSINIELKKDGATVEKQQLSFLSDYGKEEFYNATLKRNLLENMASLTGGRYYEPSQAGDIPFYLKTAKSNRSFLTSEYLWDLPLLFFLIVLILSIEWVYRRQKGLP